MIELSFHEAIRSGDSTARLVYADWLEDNGRDHESALLSSGLWCLVPAGSFWMGGGGGTAGDKQVEIPQAFYLGAYPVTQGEWQAVMGSNPSYFSRSGGGKDKVQLVSDADLERFPVETVSWDEVQAFIENLNARDKRGGILYRLPTESEWEYGCRGGARSKGECSFHFYIDQPSNKLLGSQANFHAKGTYLGRTSKVGSFQPNRLGIYDMHGNVWEWTADLHENGSYRVRTGRQLVLRRVRLPGGVPALCAPSDRDGSLGFRLASVPSRQ